MRFIVTGTPRSGTKYAAKLLTALGVPCTHEETLRPMAEVVDCLRWYRDTDSGESSWMAWTLLPLFPESVPVLHTIRDPWLVVDSLTNRNKILWADHLREHKPYQSIRDTIRHYCPAVWEWDAVVNRAAQFVLDWHDAIAAVVPQRMEYRPSSLDVPLVRRMLNHIGCERDDEKIQGALDEIATDANAGFVIKAVPGISNPLVRDWITEYAKTRDVSKVLCQKLEPSVVRSTREELAARMDSHLSAWINDYASRYGYATAAGVLAVSA